MQLLATQYTLSTQALEVYFAGCKGPHCAGCHNPESWDTKAGEVVSPATLYSLLFEKVSGSGGMVKQISLLGGEPLDQPIEELEKFISLLTNLNLPLWLFTRYEVYDIPFSLRVKFDYIKTGRFIKELGGTFHSSLGVVLGSTNQKVLQRGVDF